MSYETGFYCQYANAYVECSNKKCVDCQHYKKAHTDKNKKSDK